MHLTDNITRLAIGTAQFGLNYGISNMEGQVNREQISLILHAAIQAGVNLIDTASAYGTAEDELGYYFNVYPEVLNRIKVVSKYLPSDTTITMDATLDSLQRLKLNRLYGYLLHDFSKVRFNKYLINEFLSLKNKCAIQKIGFSLYYPKDLDFLFEYEFAFDIIQFPFNIFDQRFATYFSELKRRNIEIHTRSSFLQGLFFMDTKNLPCKLKPLTAKLKAIQHVGILNNLSVEALALGFNLSFPEIDRVIIGVNNFKNFADNLEACNQRISSAILANLRELREDDEQLILPINW